MVRKITARLRSFRDNISGNVAMMFGLCAIGVLGLSGVTIDYSRQQSSTVQLQTAADHIGLALALRSRTESAATIQAEANKLLAAILADGKISGATVTAVYTPGSPPSFKVNVTGTIDSSFGKLFGVGTLPVTAAASVPVITSNLEIALVLDNTGSMSGQGKLTQLKLASKSLISIIKTNVESKGVKARLSIVPFAQQVMIAKRMKIRIGWTGMISRLRNPTGAAASATGNSPTM